MNRNNQNELNLFISEINKSGLPYTYEILPSQEIKNSKYDGIIVYEDMPNVEEIVILKSAEHTETDNNFKFLIIESYKEPINGLKFGTPSFSYIVDNIDSSNFSCYQLDDISIKQYPTISEAAAQIVENFENQMFQKYMTLDIFENSQINTRNDKIKDLCIAESLINKFNHFGKDLFKTELDVDNLKLISFCNKYNNWTEISHTEDFNISSQVVSFLSENYPLYINEVTDLATYNSKPLNIKAIKPKNL